MIKSIELENFKCFPSIQVDCNNLTILTGVNGSGKSSILEPLLLLRQSFENQCLKDGVVCLDGELTCIKDIKSYQSEESTVTISMDFCDSQEFIWKMESQFGGDAALLKCSMPTDSVYQQAIFSNSFCYIGKTTRYGKLGQRFSSGFDFPISISNLKEPTTDSYDFQENLEAWLSDIFPNANVKTCSSEGFLHTSTIVTAILSAEPGSLLILENPENYLHPSAQSMIGRLIAMAAQNGVQVFVETHSDHILNSIRVMVRQKVLDNDKAIIHFFEVDKDNNRTRRTLKINERGKLDGWPMGFMDEFENNLDKLI